MELIIANPPRSRPCRTRRARKARRSSRRRAMTAAQRRYFAPKKRRARRKESSPMPRRRRRSSARTSAPRRRGSGGSLARGFVPAGTLEAVAGTTGGFIAASMLPGMIPGLPASLQTGWGRTAVKAGIGVGLFMLGKRLVGPRLAGAAAVGALASAALDVVRQVMPQTAGAAPAGMSGRRFVANRAGMAGMIGSAADAIDYTGLGKFNAYAANGSRHYG